MPTSDATKKPAARSAAAKPASAKPAARRSAAKGAAAKPARPAATPDDSTTPKAALSTPASSSAVSGTLRLKGLIERVAAATGGKKKAVKEIVEATLAELSQAMEKGEAMNLPGLGRIRVKAAKDGATPAAMTLKRRAATKGEGKKKVEKEPLAEGGEAG